MLRSLTSAISGLQNFQQRMDVIGNNIANVSTTAFKSARVGFADSFSQTLRSSSGGTGGNSGTTAMQIGLGSSIQTINNLYTQGALARTSVTTDLAVAGNGFFVVRDVISNNTYVTRAGDFRVDESGYLVTNNGMRVQGFSDAGPLDDGRYPDQHRGNARHFGSCGDPREFCHRFRGQSECQPVGQLSVCSWPDPAAKLQRPAGFDEGRKQPLLGDWRCRTVGWRAQPDARPSGTNGLGRIQAGALELSNVDLATEFTALITTQRGYQANARVITTSDEMLQELVNLKR